MLAEKIILNKERNVTLQAYLHEASDEFKFVNRPAMVVLPGGGYAMCSDREADAAALFYAQAGFQSFILRYSTGKDKVWPQPLEDYEQAMELIREKAEEWFVDIDKISVVGFSAGGHLAAVAASAAKNKPAAAILVYPAILDEILHMCAIEDLPDPRQFVDKNTAPCFLAAARDDRTAEVKNVLMFELALAEHDVPFESHVYSYGGHGFSTGQEWVCTNKISKRAKHWANDSVEWLHELQGELTIKGFTEPDMAVSRNGNSAPVLSVNCSLAHLNHQSEEAKEILQPMYDGIKAVAKQRKLPFEGIMTALGETTAREILEMLGISEEEVRSIDKKLHVIENRLYEE